MKVREKKEMVLKASEARKLADSVNNDRRRKAMTYVDKVWFNRLQNKVEAAAQDGFYSISYSWGTDDELNMGVTLSDFGAALENFLEELGYFVEIERWTRAGVCYKIAVKIAWEVEIS